MLDAGRVLGQAESDTAGAHAERLLPMVDQALAQAGSTRNGIERVAVGIGPGSFTGLRVGLSVGRGIARGLRVPIVGVGSLHAMASACNSTEAVVATLDARRQEVFVAAYGPDGKELIGACAIAITEFHEWLSSQNIGPHGFVGAGVALISRTPICTESSCQLPHATEVARVAAALDPAEAIATPVYVRDAGATPQKLPPSPFA